MIAILLCAGYATRMGALTENFPKSLLEVASLLDVAGKPVIDYLMDQIVTFPGLDSVHVVTNDKYYEHFNKWQKDWNSQLNIKLYNDGSTTNENRLGSIRDLQYVLNRVEPQKVFVSASDNIFRFDLSPFWKVFENNKHHYVIALHETNKEKLKRTGVLELDNYNLVKRLHEKPKNPQFEWACPPAYFYQASAFPLLDEYIKLKDKHDAPGHFVDFLCQKEKVYAFKLNASRLDIGDLETYKEANKILSKEPVIQP